MAKLNVSIGGNNPRYGEVMYEWAEDLIPICRSITGPGVRETLQYLKNIIPNLDIVSVPTGAKAFDWEVPPEWAIRDAYIATLDGDRIVDFHNNNLHVVGYSEPVNGVFTRAELLPHLHSLPSMPDAIPYITSYYKRSWGFCVAERLKKQLPDTRYRVVIDSQIKHGVLNYGELYLQSSKKSTTDVLLSTNVCHPSMANNETSGIVVTAALAHHLSSREFRKHNYRIVFLPETIGSLVFISRNLETLKNRLLAGFVVACIGDNRAFSYIPSRLGDSLTDRVIQHVLRWVDTEYKKYSWSDRGSDERQYCAPGIDLPVASLMRSKYGEYPEYHTSEDKLGSVVTAEGLQGGFAALLRAIDVVERHCYPRAVVLGEPNLGRRGLYPSTSTLESFSKIIRIVNVLTYADGKHSMVDIAEKCGCPVWELYDVVSRLREERLLECD